MTTQTITESDFKIVTPTSSVSQRAGKAGEAFATSGFLIYKDTTDTDPIKKADPGDSAGRVIIGVTTQPAADGENIVYFPLSSQAKNSNLEINFGASAVALGEQLYAVAGGLIGQWSDVQSGDRIIEVAISYVDKVLTFNFKDTGLTKA